VLAVGTDDVVVRLALLRDVAVDLEVGVPGGARDELEE
jgi:hypothetical protein